ncbi:hypothetical protein TNCV_2894641 [Trichonephila clavipes]|nr:hypothetical protein TNCV_2894641 [Trichonephila clavipes]
MCSWGNSRPNSFHTLPKLIWCGSCGCNLGQFLSNHGPHVFLSAKDPESEPAREAIQSGPAWRCIPQLFSILSPRCLQARIRHRGVADRCVTRQLRQFHSILPPTSFFHRTIGGGDVCGSASRVDQAMDILWTDHSAVNGVEWYAQTLNDALQTQCAVLRPITVFFSAKDYCSLFPFFEDIASNFDAIEKPVQRNLRVFMRQIARDMGVSDRSVKQLAKTELGLKPYKLQKVQLFTEDKLVRGSELESFKTGLMSTLGEIPFQ